MKPICKETLTQNFDLSIIPVSSKKTPYAGWKEYQSTISPVPNWHSHYTNQGYVGIICGTISGHLECIDVDIKNDPEHTINDEYTNLISPLVNTLLIQQTPSGGLHLLYRCPDAEIEGSQKLALNNNGEVIIETRGEGGYFCTHQSDYELLQGEFDLINREVNIPVISKEERQFLLDTARSLTRYFPIDSGKTFSYKEPAINIFNEEYDIVPVFERNGFEVVDADNEKISLLRDGSSASHSGYYFKESKVFFCFSTSTAFKHEKPYNNFQALMLLEGNNDYRTTLRLLNDLGYSTSSKPNKLTPEEIAEFINNNGIYFNEFTQDLELKDLGVLDQRIYNTTYLNMKKYFDKEVAKNKFDDVINSTYVHSSNPLVDFIQANNTGSTTGTIKKWFDCIQLNNPSIDRDIALTFITKWYVGLVAQALDGKYPNEFFLTLLSTEQGIGKTTLLRNYTIPKELAKYVSEHPLDLTEDFKVIMGQTLLIIDDEMDGKTWNQMNQFKSVLSTKTMTLRRKYDRRISQINRRASFAGSGNNLMIVKEYQNRRIIPIEIQSIDFVKLEKVNLTDMFMEAYDLFTGGFQYSFQRSDVDGLKHLYADYVQKSDFDLLIDEHILKPEEGDDVMFVSNLDIISALNIRFNHNGKKINNIILGKMMTERGFQTQKKGQRRTTFYIISLKSKIIEMLDNNCTSWSYNTESVVKRFRKEEDDGHDLPF